MTNPTDAGLAANPATKRKTGIPRGFRFAGSIADQIGNLQVGESVSRVTRLLLSEATPEKVQAIYNSMTSSLGSGLYRVERDKPGTAENFKTERGQCFTNDGAVLLVVAVSRIK